MHFTTATTGTLTGSGSAQNQLSCEPARRLGSLTAFVFNDQPTSSASQSAFVHDLPGKFSFTITTANQFYHRNQQYSIIALTDDSGDILERYSYTAYGEPAFFNGAGTLQSGSAHGNRYTYTGREWDGVVKLYHYRARMYDPQLGRFLGRDPAGLTPDLNGYRYALGNSVRWNDPLGLEVPKYDLDDVQDCIVVLGTIPLTPNGFRLANYPCAKSLLNIFMNGSHTGQTVCTPECEHALQQYDWGPAFGNILREEFWMRKGSCGASGRINLSFGLYDNSFDYGNSQQEQDLYYAFHAYTLSTLEAECNWQCQSKNADSPCCCNCNATCGATIHVKDTYDFCSSYKDGPGFGNQLAKCGCIIEDYRKKLGRPSGVFTVDCHGGTHNGFSTSFKTCDSSYIPLLPNGF